MDEDVPAVADAARAIASGHKVDWHTLESSADDDASREVLRALESVARIAAFHQTWQAPAAPIPVQLPSTWGTLTLAQEIGRGSFGRVYSRSGSASESRRRAQDPRRSPRVRHARRERCHRGRAAPRTTSASQYRFHSRRSSGGRPHRARDGADAPGGRSRRSSAPRGPLVPMRRLLVGRDVCRALAAVHGAGLVHRDVKAQNVIREQGGRIVLMDFGAGRPVDALGSPANGWNAAVPRAGGARGHRHRRRSRISTVLACCCSTS